MKRISTRALLFAAVAAALGFGAAQSLAAPAAAAGPPACRARECADQCQAQGATGGFCYDGQFCRCLFTS